jgi:two-component system response regulator ChvI
VEKRIRVAFVGDDDDYRETVSGELADHGYDAPLRQPGN